MAGLDITEHATAEPLSLEMAKRQLQLDCSFTLDDEYIVGLIRAVREKAELWTARSYLTRTFREYFDGFPEQRLPIPYNVIYDIPARHDYEPRQHNKFELSRSPIQSVLGIYYLDQNGVEQTLDPSIYYVSPWKEPAHILRTPPNGSTPVPCWPIPQHRADSVWVDYVAGYGAPIAVSIASAASVTTGTVFPAYAAGQLLSIPGAGAAGAELFTSILSIDSHGNATLSTAASATVSGVKGWLGIPLPALPLQGMLMLLTHWYENRLPVVAAASINELPYTVKGCFDGNRVYYQA